MSKPRSSQSKSGELAQQVKSLQARILSAPEPVKKKWIKAIQSDLKGLVEQVKNKAVSHQMQLLQHLQQLSKELISLDEKRKKEKIRRSKASAPLNKSKTSVRSGKSAKSRKSSKSQKRKTSKQATPKKGQTPEFKKKPFQNKLGSFAKDFQRSRSKSSVSSRSKSSRKQLPYSSQESSPISLESDLKQAIHSRNNHHKETVRNKYENFVEAEKKITEIDIGQLSKEENLILTTKLEGVTKEKLLREYRILFYRSKEVRKLLSEYYEQNLQLNDQIHEMRQDAQASQELLRRLKKENKDQAKQLKYLNSEYDQKIEALSRNLQQQEYNTVPLSDFEHVKSDNEKLIIELTMLREDHKHLQMKLQEEQQQQTRRNYQMDYQQDNNYKRELEQARDQITQLREDNLRQKLLFEKEQLQNRDLYSQITSKRNELEGTSEQRNHEINSLKQQLLAVNSKKDKLEQQLQNMKFQMMGEQDGQFSVKERVCRLEEELRIASLRVENREKELNEYRNKELAYKKRIIEVESKLEAQSKQDQYPQMYETAQFIQQNIQKDLQNERALLTKTQDQLLQTQTSYDQLNRQCIAVEAELQFEQGQSASLKLKLQSLTQEHELLTQKLQKYLEDSDKTGQRIMDLESELKTSQKNEQANEFKVKELSLNQERLQIKLEQSELKAHSLNQENRELKQNNLQLEKQSNIKSEQIQQLERELASIDKAKEDYKNKYQKTKQETKKIITSLSEKENLLKQSYSEELEKIKIEKEQFMYQKQQEEQQRMQKEKKLKVISEVQSMIKDHKALK